MVVSKVSSSVLIDPELGLSSSRIDGIATDVVEGCGRVLGVDPDLTQVELGGGGGDDGATGTDETVDTLSYIHTYIHILFRRVSESKHHH